LALSSDISILRFSLPRAVVSIGTGLWTETAMCDLRRDVNRISGIDVQGTSIWKKLNFMYNSATDTQRAYCLF
jgi:hypothetical protein